MQAWIAAVLAALIGGSLMLAACGGGGAPSAGTSTHVPSATLESVKQPPVQPLPTVSTAPYLRLGSFQFLDSKTGWISAESCRDQPRPTPDEHGTAPTGPPTCKSGFYGTTDGGQTWSLLSNNTIGEFQFDGPMFGLAVNSDTYCAHGPCPSTVYCTQGQCPSTVLRTTDGGTHWVEAYTSTNRLSHLTIVDREAWVLANSCEREDNGSRCILSLLKSRDAGVTWNEIAIPVTPSFSFTISRPTARDAWIATMTGGPGAAQLFATHDDGMTWKELLHPTGRGSEAAIFFRTSTDGWLLIGAGPSAGNEAKELFSTRNGGATWTHASGSLERPGAMNPGEVPSYGYVGPVLFTSAQEGWITLFRAGILHSMDAGKHWTMALGPSETPLGLQFTDQQHGWTATDGYPSLAGPLRILWSTSDGGTTWQRVPLPAPESP